MNAVLEIHELCKNFGGLKAVDAVSFSLQPGDVAALIGPNGAGKTTCFNLLGGTLVPNSGRIIFNGHEIGGWPTHKRARSGIGRTFQIAATFRSMTVLENVETALMALGKDPARATAQLAEVGLSHLSENAVTSLAYGDVKRVELAMVLALEPTLLLLDEPTAGMASEERRHIMRWISDTVSARNITVLFTEHDMDAVFGFATRILAMDQGKLIADGTPEAVRTDAQVRQVYLGDVPEGTQDA